MAKKNPPLRLVLSFNNDIHFAETKEFNDWWDLADYVKQENLQGRAVCIHHWVYVYKGG